MRRNAAEREIKTIISYLRSLDIKARAGPMTIDGNLIIYIYKYWYRDGTEFLYKDGHLRPHVLGCTECSLKVSLATVEETKRINLCIDAFPKPDTNTPPARPWIPIEDRCLECKYNR